MGGSAVTAYAPEVHTSYDIDFAAINGANRHEFGSAVAPLGFKAEGRDFVHAQTTYTLDLVADTPYIDRHAITEFEMLKTTLGLVRVIKFEDALADRVAAFLHWSDSQSLDVAEKALKKMANDTDWRRVRRALARLDTSLPKAAQRFKIALGRLRRAYAAGKMSSKKS
ncbi:MAG: hypothetical protein GIX02_01855 [Candidatus Eremiobacteraeota bacterium]|nr:hypothetical protein [Candidatus Eremiobacteraeota bacterium]